MGSKHLDDCKTVDKIETISFHLNGPDNGFVSINCNGQIYINYLVLKLVEFNTYM